MKMGLEAEEEAIDDIQRAYMRQEEAKEIEKLKGMGMFIDVGTFMK